MRSAPSEPELPDRVPEKRDAVTPDLPPFGPGAPDLPDAGHAPARREGSHGDDGMEDDGEESGSEGSGSEGSAGPQGERPTAGPGNAKPQEPTD
ncbi:hypothetical protein ACFVX6_17095 [Streptomyces sp. NPDC058289]|uniref:hypothetical protein n=1 Tax=Streptomyces sp. NPDC058289 TaxID=3346425 RepID=UPI0036E19CD7